MVLSEKAKQSKRIYTAEYKKQNIKRVPLDIQKNKYEEIKKAATNCNETINGYIKKAIDMRLDNNF